MTRSLHKSSPEPPQELKSLITELLSEPYAVEQQFHEMNLDQVGRVLEDAADELAKPNLPFELMETAASYLRCKDTYCQILLSLEFTEGASGIPSESLSVLLEGPVTVDRTDAEIPFALEAVPAESKAGPGIVLAPTKEDAPPVVDHTAHQKDESALTLEMVSAIEQRPEAAEPPPVGKKEKKAKRERVKQPPRARESEEEEMALDMSGGGDDLALDSLGGLDDLSLDAGDMGEEESVAPPQKTETKPPEPAKKATKPVPVMKPPTPIPHPPPIHTLEPEDVPILKPAVEMAPLEASEPPPVVLASEPTNSAVQPEPELKPDVAPLVEEAPDSAAPYLTLASRLSLTEGPESPIARRLAALALCLGAEATAWDSLEQRLNRFWSSKNEGIRPLFAEGTLDLKEEVRTALLKLAAQTPERLDGKPFPLVAARNCLRYLLAAQDLAAYHPSLLDYGLALLFFGNGESIGGVSPRDWLALGPGLSGAQTTALGMDLVGLQLAKNQLLFSSNPTSPQSLDRLEKTVANLRDLLRVLPRMGLPKGGG